MPIEYPLYPVMEGSLLFLNLMAALTLKSWIGLGHETQQYISYVFSNSFIRLSILFIYLFLGVTTLIAHSQFPAENTLEASSQKFL